MNSSQHKKSKRKDGKKSITQRLLKLRFACILPCLASFAVFNNYFLYKNDLLFRTENEGQLDAGSILSNFFDNDNGGRDNNNRGGGGENSRRKDNARGDNSNEEDVHHHQQPMKIYEHKPGKLLPVSVKAKASKLHALRRFGQQQQQQQQQQQPQKPVTSHRRVMLQQEEGASTKEQQKQQVGGESGNGNIMLDERLSMSKNATFSACLLIRDDNEILNEWIAYHYHVIKLRKLIVAIDPQSKTSPTLILQKWAKEAPDLDIELWEDSYYMSEKFLKSGVPPVEMTDLMSTSYMRKHAKMIIHNKNGTTTTNAETEAEVKKSLNDIAVHRYRQRFFLLKCIKKLKTENRTWTIHIDTDEYVVVSKLLRRMGPKYIPKFNSMLPTIEEPGSVLSFVQNMVRHDAKTINYPCLTMLRTLYGSVETTAARRALKTTPDENDPTTSAFNSTNFETLRWNYHGDPNDRSKHGFSKVIIDVNAIPDKILYNEYINKGDMVMSIHRPFFDICLSSESQHYQQFKKMTITANHYLGSWERYSSRNNDVRRNYKIYEQKANVSNGFDDGIKFWLKGFVNDIGIRNATSLLGDQYISNTHKGTLAIGGSDNKDDGIYKNENDTNTYLTSFKHLKGPDNRLVLETPYMPESELHNSMVNFTNGDSKNFVSLLKDATFSACMLVKDDNEILNEWIAYHFHVLKMRRLILAVDPTSETSPSSILKKWGNVGVLDIDEWEDSAYMPEKFLETGMPPGTSNVTALMSKPWIKNKYTEEQLRRVIIARYRERVFYMSCLKKLKMEKRTWVVYVDPNEFVNTNQLLREKYKVPSIAQSGSLLSVMKKMVGVDPKLLNYPCVSMLRTLYGGVESSEGNRFVGVPQGYDANNFETLRWRYHISTHDMGQHGLPKVILDLDAIPYKYLERFGAMVQSVNRPFHDLCRSTDTQYYSEFRKYPLTANRYLGTWEKFKSKHNDAKKNRESYDEKKLLSSERDDGTRAWLRGFVSNVGKDNAEYLLGRKYLWNSTSPWPGNQTVTTSEDEPLFDNSSLAFAPNATFSGCLLIRDDNDILNEWIAYHYHSLRMRRLIVATDPLSVTSPSPILQKWNSSINIEEWDDSKFMPEFFMENGVPPVNLSNYMTRQWIRNNYNESTLKAVAIHRYRQRVFLLECIKKLKDEGRTWLIHVDTDEFVGMSKLVRENTNLPVQLPSIEQPGSILTSVQELLQHNARIINYPCLSMIRILFGSVESTDEERFKGATEGINATQLETFRWRYHSNPNDHVKYGLPKVILDISAIPGSLLTKGEMVQSIHRPFFDICRLAQMQQYGDYRKYPFTANHYLGSWERYVSRGDIRRNRETYDQKANLRVGSDDGIRPWLKGFVEDVGKEKASHLLGDQYLLK